MRVQGNVSPEAVTVEQYLPIPGMVEVRLWENITLLEENLYEYDEYTALMKDRPGLAKEISDSLPDWLITLRTLEVNPNASAYKAAAEENAALLESMAQMVDDIYQSDLEMMGL